MSVIGLSELLPALSSRRTALFEDEKEAVIEALMRTPHFSNFKMNDELRAALRMCYEQLGYFYFGPHKLIHKFGMNSDNILFLLQGQANVYEYKRDSDLEIEVFYKAQIDMINDKIDQLRQNNNISQGSAAATAGDGKSNNNAESVKRQISIYQAEIASLSMINSDHCVESEILSEYPQFFQEGVCLLKKKRTLCEGDSLSVPDNFRELVVVSKTEVHFTNITTSNYNQFIVPLKTRNHFFEFYARHNHISSLIVRNDLAELTLKSGDKLYQTGQQTNGMIYLIRSGQVALCQAGNDKSRILNIRFFKPGEFLAIEDILLPNRLFTVTATTSTVLYALKFNRTECNSNSNSNSNHNVNNTSTKHSNNNKNNNNNNNNNMNSSNSIANTISSSIQSIMTMFTFKLQQFYNLIYKGILDCQEQSNIPQADIFSKLLSECNFKALNQLQQQQQLLASQPSSSSPPQKTAQSRQLHQNIHNQGLLLQQQSKGAIAATQGGLSGTFGDCISSYESEQQQQHSQYPQYQQFQQSQSSNSPSVYDSPSLIRQANLNPFPRTPKSNKNNSIQTPQSHTKSRFIEQTQVESNDNIKDQKQLRQQVELYGESSKDPNSVQREGYIQNDSMQDEIAQIAQQHNLLNQHSTKANTSSMINNNKNNVISQMQQFNYSKNDYNENTVTTSENQHNNNINNNHTDTIASNTGNINNINHNNNSKNDKNHHNNSHSNGTNIIKIINSHPSTNSGFSAQNNSDAPEPIRLKSNLSTNNTNRPTATSTTTNNNNNTNNNTLIAPVLAKTQLSPQLFHRSVPDLSQVEGTMANYFSDSRDNQPAAFTSHSPSTGFPSSLNQTKSQLQGQVILQVKAPQVKPKALNNALGDSGVAQTQASRQFFSTNRKQSDVSSALSSLSKHDTTQSLQQSQLQLQQELRTCSSRDQLKQLTTPNRGNRGNLGLLEGKNGQTNSMTSFPEINSVKQNKNLSASHLVISNHTQQQQQDNHSSKNNRSYKSPNMNNSNNNSNSFGVKALTETSDMPFLNNSSSNNGNIFNVQPQPRVVVKSSAGGHNNRKIYSGSHNNSHQIITQTDETSSNPNRIMFKQASNSQTDLSSMLNKPTLERISSLTHVPDIIQQFNKQSVFQSPQLHQESLVSQNGSHNQLNPLSSNTISRRQIYFSKSPQQSIASRESKQQ